MKSVLGAKAMLSRDVSSLLREVADLAILPRFQRLASGDVRDKSPGEEVTVADEEAEHLLTARLRDLLPGSVVIGEEAVARAPDLLREVGRETAWLVDPLDGTANFVAGSTCFSMMVCLLRKGEAVEAWMLSPASGVLHAAQKGGGAWIDGERISTSDAPSLSNTCGAILTRFLPDDLRARVLANSRGLRAVLPGLRCAGEEYPAIVRGDQHFALYGRTLPWDHAAGALFLTEAGGRVADFDGRLYSPVNPRFGLLAASTAPLWSELRQHLLEADRKS
jgi:fructose-1,6-bisphosphatase/inositol monophosphatase family enzyme